MNRCDGCGEKTHTYTVDQRCDCEDGLDWDEYDDCYYECTFCDGDYVTYELCDNCLYEEEDY